MKHHRYSSLVIYTTMNGDAHTVTRVQVNELDRNVSYDEFAQHYKSLYRKPRKYAQETRHNLGKSQLLALIKLYNIQYYIIYYIVYYIVLL